MHLQALRPKQGASLVQLRTLLDGRGWKSSMPMSLPDTVLLSLARDFRCVEGGPDTPESEAHEESHSLAAAMYVVMNLLLHHPDRVGGKDQLQISEVGLMRAFQVYQVGLEREIVTRITGLSSSIPPDALADELLRCANERDG